MSTNDFKQLRDVQLEAHRLRDAGRHAESEALLRSIIEALDTTISDSEHHETETIALRIEVLNDLAWILGGSNKLDAGKETSEAALALAVKSHNEKQQSRSLHGIAQYYSSTKQYGKAGQYFDAAIALSRKVRDLRNTANILSNIGLMYARSADLEKALDYFSESLPIHEQIGNKRSIAVTCGQIGLIYDELLQHELSLEYNLKVAAIMEELGDFASAGGAYNNIGFNYANLGEYEKSRESYLRAIGLREQAGETDHISYPITNLGDVLRQMGRYEASRERLLSGLALTRSRGERLQEGRTLAYLARLYTTPEYAEYDTNTAIQYTFEALDVFKQLTSSDEHARAEIVKQHYLLADLFKRQGQFEKALHHFSEFHHTDKEVRNAGVLAKSAQFEQKIAFVTERARAQATEALLHKTLPKTIADRVMLGDTRIADHYDSVSILFADVVNFTKLSAHLPPATVLDFMNFIFERFDAIALKHDCERIKTIGDGYMVVCGAPVRVENHAERMALMALDMMEDIQLPDTIRQYLPEGTVFHLRIGIHCGEITAGLIGTGKLAYDIYGDAVNTASRMESHGEAGKIHCSADFVTELQQSNVVSEIGLSIHERGEVDIKGKGLMRTYFLDRTAE